jgi:hypothetical protein
MFDVTRKARRLWRRQWLIHLKMKAWLDFPSWKVSLDATPRDLAIVSRSSDPWPLYRPRRGEVVSPRVLKFSIVAYDRVLLRLSLLIDR